MPGYTAGIRSGFLDSSCSQTAVSGVGSGMVGTELVELLSRKYERSRVGELAIRAEIESPSVGFLQTDEPLGFGPQPGKEAGGESE